MSKRPVIFALLGMALLPFLATAQTKNIDDVQIVFEKSKEIILPIEDKPISNRQQNLKTDTIARDFSSLQNDLQKPANVLDLKPRVLNYTVEPEAGGKPNYLKLGAGNFVTTQLEGLYSHGNKEDYVAAKILHFNSALGSQKWASQGVNQLDVFGTYKALKGRIKANLLVENNRNTLYSFIPDGITSKSDIRISNLRTGFDAGYSYSKTNKYDLDLGLKLNAVSSFNDQKGYFASIGGKYTQRLDEQSSFGVKPLLAVSKIASDTPRTVTFLDVQGEYTRTVGALTVRPWVKFLYESDTIDKKSVHLYPGIEGNFAISKQLNIYGSVYSDYSQNLLFDQIKVNPWLAQTSQFSYLNMPLGVFVGIKGNVTNFGIDVSGGIKQYKNYLVYAPNGGNRDSSRFYAINLRDNAVTISYLSATATYRVSETFNVETALLLQSASSSFKPSIPNVPSATWRISPAIRAGGFAFVPSLILRSSYDLLTPELTTVKSGATYDLAAKASYSFSNRISLNVDVYNLANNRPALYYGYYTRGVTVVGGATFKF